MRAGRSSQAGHNGTALLRRFVRAIVLSGGGAGRAA